MARAAGGSDRLRGWPDTGDGSFDGFDCGGDILLGRQEGRGHALVGFCGAEQAEKYIRWKPATRTACDIGELSRAYPGAGKQLMDARFKNWPEDPFVRASYAFPAKGDITRWGPIFDRGVGNLHFAGEHTCYAFIGYMEGALQSGIRVANRLIVRDKIANPIP